VIQLHSHCLVFETANGEHIPCAVEDVSVEVIGAAVDQLDHEIVKQAAAAVLHYFKVERQQTIVTIAEFTVALEEVLRGLGLVMASAEPISAADLARPVAETSLDLLAEETGDGGELLFFPRLREEMRQQLSKSPRLVRFNGLHDCVKRLVGARRWCDRCRAMSDQIVGYLRQCLDENHRADCALVVS
jgi:hypothetical protein